MTSSPLPPPAPASVRGGRPAVFLDRDGTMNEDVGYLSELSHLTLYPWAIDVVRLFNRAGYAVVVITNQGGIGRGMIRPEFVGELHAAIAARLARGGAHVDGWYHCPHHPAALVDALKGDCRCRKPEPGMLLDAVRDLGLDPARSWMIGDKWHDVQVGAARRRARHPGAHRLGTARGGDAARGPDGVCDLRHAGRGRGGGAGERPGGRVTATRVVL